MDYLLHDKFSPHLKQLIRLSRTAHFEKLLSEALNLIHISNIKKILQVDKLLIIIADLPKY